MKLIVGAVEDDDLADPASRDGVGVAIGLVLRADRDRELDFFARLFDEVADIAAFDESAEPTCAFLVI
jgi:hypothetical protein